MSAILLLAQGATAGTNHMGFRGGVNLSKVEGDDAADVESVTRPMGGVVGLFDLTDWIAFQFEVAWSGKGTKGTIPIDFFGQQAVIGTFNLNYLEIPLLLRFNPVQQSRYQPYLYGGSGIAANLSASVSGEFGDGSPLPNSTTDGIDEIVTDGDLLLIGGGGVALLHSRMRIELDARYSRGLLTVDESRFSVDPKNRTWAFSIAMLFRLGE